MSVGMGPANYDMNPTEQSAILDTWEDRFDAYLVGVGSDTITLAVGRPPRDLSSGLAIAAEHLAFCSDNIYPGRWIDQGVRADAHRGASLGLLVGLGALHGPQAIVAPRITNRRPLPWPDPGRY